MAGSTLKETENHLAPDEQEVLSPTSTEQGVEGTADSSVSALLEGSGHNNAVTCYIISLCEEGPRHSSVVACMRQEQSSPLTVSYSVIAGFRGLMEIQYFRDG